MLFYLEFDDEVQRERIKAQDALESTEKIEIMIQTAIKDIFQLEKILNGSENNARSAHEKAQHAQAYAEKASKNANDIRIQANRTKLEALRLGNEAEILHLRVDTTDSLMKDYEVQVGKDTNVTTEANHKVGQAKINVGLTATYVDKALSDIAEIIKELQDLPELDDTHLNHLEERLTAAEKEIKAANLDQRIKALTDAKNMQTQWVKNYEDEVNRLRIEVENIDDIRKALPADCFKRVRLEP